MNGSENCDSNFTEFWPLFMKNLNRPMCISGGGTRTHKSRSSLVFGECPEKYTRVCTQYTSSLEVEKPRHRTWQKGAIVESLLVQLSILQTSTVYSITTLPSVVQNCFVDDCLLEKFFSLLFMKPTPPLLTAKKQLTKNHAVI